LNASLCCATKSYLGIGNLSILANDRIGNLSILANDRIGNLSILADDRYDTIPLEIVSPQQPPVDEEIIYSSFEDALSGRLTALNDHWNSQSNGQLTSIEPAPSYATNLSLVTQPYLFTSIWLRRIIHACLALMLLMAGFDVMGMLVLHIY
jgi:hypothetical protein